MSAAEFDIDAELNGEAGEGDDSQMGGTQNESQEQQNGEGEGDENGEDGEGADGDNNEEDEEDEEEGSGEETSRPAKRRKIKRKGNRFIDIEAEVDEDDDEEEDDEDLAGGTDGFVVNGAEQAGPEEDFDEASANRQNRAYDRRHQNMEDNDLVDIAAKIDQRERARRQAAKEADEMGASGQLPRNYLMPDINDPTIWALKVKPGREQALILSISRKAATQDLHIVSAFFRDSLKGYIYVEARSEAHVRSAVHGLVGVYATNQPLLIPLEERPDLLRTKKKDVQLQVGGWVRFKRGKYAGDVAQVVDVPENADAITIKFVPRIDMNPKKEEDNPDGKKRKKAPSNTSAFRPAQHFFNADEIKSVYPPRAVTYAKGIYHFQNDDYEDGYCLKDVRLTGLNIEDINPTIDEITKFAGEARTAAKATKSGDLDDDDADPDKDRDQTALNLSLIADAARKTANLALQPGDHVEIFDGDSKGVIGVVDSIVNEIVTLTPSEDEHPELAGTKMDVSIKSVRKKFKIGDHVKVLSGSNADETGLVISLNGETVTFHSDLSGEEITVFAKDLREAAEVGSGINTIGQYQLHDLVQLDAQTCGVIYKIERGVFRVLDQSGQVKGVRPANLQGKVVSNEALATDADGNTVNLGDTMKESAGSYSSVQRTGKVLHIYRSLFAFLYSRDYAENGGVFVTYAQYLTSAAPKQTRGTDFSKLNPELMPPPGARAPLQEDTNIAGTSGSKRIRDPIIGMLVTIMKGPQKGFQGIVKDANGTATRIELSSNNKIVNVDRSRLYAKGKGGLAAVDEAIASLRFSGGEGGPRNGQQGGYRPSGGQQSRTPGYPSAGGRTQNSFGGNQTGNPYSAGGQTSNPYASGGATSNPYANGGRTTNPYSNGASTTNPYSGGATPSGNRSSYGGDSFAAGSKTPYGGNASSGTWSASSQTPHGGATQGSSDTWSASSKTPFGNSGASDYYSQPSGAKSPHSRAPQASTSYSTRSGQNSSYGGSGRTPSGAPTPYSSAPTPHNTGNNAFTPYSAAPTPAAAVSREDPERRAMREAAMREAEYSGNAHTPAAPTPAPYDRPAGTATNIMPLKNSRWGSNASGAPTPAAPTPGYDMTAPTPGAAYHSAQTPGFSAQTPAFSAQTPGFSAPTPGFSGATPGFSGVTPGFSGATPAAYGQTPGLHFGAPTPAAGGIAQRETYASERPSIPADWAEVGLFVVVTMAVNGKSFMDGRHNDQQATIFATRSDATHIMMCTVQLASGGEDDTLTIPIHFLRPLYPQARNQDVVVLASGKYRGSEMVTDLHDDDLWVFKFPDGQKETLHSTMLCLFDKGIKESLQG